jgi:hypothetical protein
MLWDAGHAYLQFMAATSNVRKTLDIIDNMDFSPTVFHSDLCGPKFIPKLLQLASEVLEKASEYAIHAVGDVKFSEERKTITERSKKIGDEDEEKRQQEKGKRKKPNILKWIP